MSSVLQAPLDDAAPQATVLCVDDEANILSALRRVFRPAGYRVLLAESGAAGLALLEQEAVDLVISDMRMPEMNGAQFLAQVRQRWPDTVRLLLTGYSDIQSIQDAINNGEIYRYITKPWEDGDMLLLVRHALERRQLEQDKQRLEALTQRQNEELKALNQDLEAKVEARTRQLKAEHEATVAANAKLKHNFVTTIKIFSSMIELRAHNQPGHARQVAELARQLAARLGLEGREAQDVFIAALLHDIGKIGFSDELLQTPLTLLRGEALARFRKHPVRAEELLMPLEDLRGSAAILRCQLERFDGQGFPDGLAGLAIPLGARILALAADYYNLQQGAMVQRHLRADEAKSLILDAGGKRYDPHVVAAFRQLIDDTAEPGAGVEVLSGELLPGMVLARDLVSRDGLMLLTVDHVLDARMIQQVQDFETKSGSRLAIWVRNPRESS
ncbi:Response regulator c-di-GMP phosphodiesterase, RpfG family, contains REC and HD-GYP domains [Duganella sp. CF402]|uniref:HD domain-containing phosphohydrolase n=1 Tax=unclassified Duganella TaxID=2636909 RepID=UPI0008D573D3|nr:MULTISPECIES: HD domain-containing phosphohydrolase [unclassified Duganella]RZT11350.1 response regulator RpfG family c-di-GMP phosphodiesterase [Duganella sp. BK701]SEK68874.1 Response regulator c-di-GMP phosphodiesterase, RpfG family, contains REC and HD-GYP domains [Duganella sp. CF402]